MRFGWRSYASEKSDVELSLVYGHNMRQDGMADSKRLRAFVYPVDGSSSELEIIPSDGRYLLKYAFTASLSEITGSFCGI
jgi:hypothetical protein